MGVANTPEQAAAPVSDYQAICAEVERLASVAGTYLEDGAPRTAAARFRAAADRCEEIAAIRDAALAKST